MKPTKPYVRILTLLPLLALVMSLNQCSCSDTLGSLFVTEQDEAKIGAQFDAELRGKTTEYPLFKANTPRKAQFEEYVQGVFRKILSNVPADQKPGYDFKLTLVDQPIINAFAVPGGYVYLYTGIVDSMQAESELAGVLAHEISHVTHHHYRDAMMKTAGISLIIDALSGSDSSQLKKAVGGIFGQLASLQVSRSNESEADAYGTRYLAYAGWDPYGISDFFFRMPSEGIAWLSTHPAPTDRVQAVKDLVHAEGEGQNGQPAWNSGAKYIPRFLEQKTNLHN